MRFEASHRIVTPLVILVILGFLHLSLALRCWQCKGQISVKEFKQRNRQSGPILECVDPFSNATAILDDCETRGTNLHQPWCRKTIQRSNDVILFERSCDLSHEEPEYELGNRNGRQNRIFQSPQHRCASRADPNGDFMDDCWCRGQDGCNSFETDISLAFRSSSSWNRNLNQPFILICGLLLTFSHFLRFN